MTLKKRGDVYHATFRSAGGKLKSVTTRCTDKDEALKVVKQSGLKDLEMAARAGRLTTEAVSHIASGRRMTVAKAIPEFDLWLRSIGKSPKTIANVMTTLNAWIHFHDWIKHHPVGGLPPTAITEKHINEWINDPTSDAKASTRAVCLSALRMFFRFCCAKGWSLGDPAQLVRVNMKALSHEQKEKDVRQCFTELEARKIVKDCEKRGDTFWLFAVRISCEIGLRLGDICQLEWSCFNDPNRAVVWTDKRDRRVSVPVSDALATLVTEIPVADPKYLFPEQRVIINDLTKRASLSMQFKRLCERLEIKGKSFHCLRHTRITKWAKEGRSLEAIAKDVGHSDTDTTKQYVH